MPCSFECGAGSASLGQRFLGVRDAEANIHSFPFNKPILFEKFTAMPAYEAPWSRTGLSTAADPMGSDGVLVLRKASARLRVSREQPPMVCAPAPVLGT